MSGPAGSGPSLPQADRGQTGQEPIHTDALGQGPVRATVPVSVVIVNYNGGSLVSDVVRSVLDSTVETEIFLSDNGSTDGSLQRLRRAFGASSKVRILENGANLGFARAVNLGLRHVRGDFLLVLNPDCVLREDSLEGLVSALAAAPEAGMAGCLVTDEDGLEQRGTRRSIPDPWSSLVRFSHLNRVLPARWRQPAVDLAHEPLPVAPVFVDAVSGACMLVRREALEQVGELDEGYFLHCEDLDWFVRFARHGWKILFVPDVVVVHHQGTCSRHRPVRVLWHKSRGMARFFDKFYASHYAFLPRMLVVFAIWLRFVVVAPLVLVSALLNKSR